MAAHKSVFYCQNCGAQSVRWLGRCPSCGEWNSYVEEVVTRKKTGSTTSSRGSHAQRLADLQPEQQMVLPLPDDELNRVLGGGLVPGSVVLLGGEPGFGKSTLLLQLALQASAFTVLYVSGEESLQQIRLRADRFAKPHTGCWLLAETDLDAVLAQAETLQPQLIIVDSIQTLQSAALEAPAGSVGQVRDCTAALIRYAKENNAAIILVGHITKEGLLAGPKVLEHMVDVVLQLEGDRHHAYRILRSLKNRFGSALELGIYELTATGMMPVKNPSQLLLTERSRPVSGFAVATMMEGNRPLLIETQALVTPYVYGTPQRSATGYDPRRLNMLLAVLEKRCGLRFGVHDVFFNIAGGLRVEDPAVDLAAVASLISSYHDVALPAACCFCGEIGLSGEVRAVSRMEQRLNEADRMGFEKIFLSAYNKKSFPPARRRIQTEWIDSVSSLIEKLV